MLALTIFSVVMMTMERHKPTKEYLEALYDLINELLPDAPIYYSSEELKELPTKEGMELL